MAECVQSINVICKHVESTRTFYVDFAPQLGSGETVSSIVSVTAQDTNLTVSSLAVLTNAYTDTQTIRDEEGNTTTKTYVIAANKGISFKLAGGSTGAGCSIVTAKVLTSSGETPTVDCRVEVHGVDV